MTEPTPQQSYIEIREVTMAYGSNVIQRDLSFTINQGDIFVIMGGSGCGKSTLLKNMLGLIPPSSGDILYSGTSFFQASAAQQGAKDRVRGNFLLLRVAEKEKLNVTEEDVTRRVIEMAARYEIPVGKLVKDLERRNGFGPLREQILIGKALDLLAANVRVRESSSEPVTA